MRKIIALILAILLVLIMATPALAATPALKIPDLPEIPSLTDAGKKAGENILGDNFWDGYFKKNPIMIDWSIVKWFH